MSSRSRLSPKEVDRHLEQHSKSGLSVLDYCQQHHLKIASFYNWRSRRSHRTLEGSDPQWVALSPVAAREPQPSGYPRQAPPIGCSSPTYGNPPDQTKGVLVELTLPGGLLLTIKPA